MEREYKHVRPSRNRRSHRIWVGRPDYHAPNTPCPYCVYQQQGREEEDREIPSLQGLIKHFKQFGKSIPASLKRLPEALKAIGDFILIALYIIFDLGNLRTGIPHLLLAELMSFALTCIAIAFGIIGAYGIYLMFHTPAFSFGQHALLFMLSCIFLLYGLILRQSANELHKEKDRGYIASIFSGLVAFAALIISVMSYLKT